MLLPGMFFIPVWRERQQAVIKMYAVSFAGIPYSRNERYRFKRAMTKYVYRVLGYRTWNTEYLPHPRRPGTAALIITKTLTDEKGWK